MRIINHFFKLLFFNNILIYLYLLLFIIIYTYLFSIIYYCLHSKIFTSLLYISFSPNEQMQYLINFVDIIFYTCHVI